MSTADTVAEVKEEQKKRGRPKKQDKASPQGEYRIEEAKKLREQKTLNPVVETYYMTRNEKLILCKKRKSGSVLMTFVGSVSEKKGNEQVREFAKKLKAEGKLRQEV